MSVPVLISDDLAEKIRRIAVVLDKDLSDLAEDVLDCYVEQLQDPYSVLNLEFESRTWDTEAECREVIPRIVEHLQFLEGEEPSEWEFIIRPNQSEPDRFEIVNV